MKTYEEATQVTIEEVPSEDKIVVHRLGSFASEKAVRIIPANKVQEIVYTEGVPQINELAA